MKWAWAAFAAVAVATVSPAQPKRTLRLAMDIARLRRCHGRADVSQQQ